MSSFDIAIMTVLKNEGSDYTDADGNPTKFGLTQKFLHDYGVLMSVDEIKALSHDQATAIYKSAIWDKFGLSRIQNQLIANYIFDMVVNLGDHEAIMLAQRAVWAATSRLNCKVDGVLGDLTVMELNNAPSGYMQALRAVRIMFYVELVEREPAKLKFLNGWLHRAVETCI